MRFCGAELRVRGLTRTVLPRDRAVNIGHLSNRYLITTHGAGGPEYLGWRYKSNQSFRTDPQIRVRVESFAEWQPLKPQEQAEITELAPFQTPSPLAATSTVRTGATSAST